MAFADGGQPRKGEESSPCIEEPTVRPFMDTNGAPSLRRSTPSSPIAENMAPELRPLAGMKTTPFSLQSKRQDERGGFKREVPSQKRASRLSESWGDLLFRIFVVAVCVYQLIATYVG